MALKLKEESERLAVLKFEMTMTVQLPLSFIFTWLGTPVLLSTMMYLLMM